MSIITNSDKSNMNLPIQEEVELNINEKPSQQEKHKKKGILNPKSNAAKRKRPTHRKPPRSDFDPTSPLGVLTSFEIPNMLKNHHEKVCQILGIKDFKSIEPLTINDIINPVRDIINDVGVLDAFNWRELKNVEVLCMSAKGDGLAIIKSPTFENILKCQNEAHEKEKKEIEEYKEKIKKERIEQGILEEEEEEEKVNNVKIDGGITKKRYYRPPTEEPYRRIVKKENLPKVQIAIIPFAFPGDFVNIKVYHTNTHYVDAEIIEFTHLSPLRFKNISGRSEDVVKIDIDPSSLKPIKPNDVPCAYFGICSGCQYQSISYENQLEIKKEVIENAYQHFCRDEVNWKGKIFDTVASPLKYGYRTKLTPHYDVPRSGTKGLGVPRLGFGFRGKGSWLEINKNKKYDENEPVYDNSKLELYHPLNDRKGMRERSLKPYFGDVLDIEDCIIGTDIVRLGFINERERLKKDWNRGIRSKKGVTVLLRENSVINNEEGSEERIFGSREILKDNDDDNVNNNDNNNNNNHDDDNTDNEEEEGPITKLEIEVDGIDGIVTKTCVTDNQKIVSDLVDTGLGRILRFDFIANEFFQNNNSILPKVIKYVKDNLGSEMEYLVDAYCGSGLFSVAIASSIDNQVKKVLGVEISERAVEFAKKNAILNNISQEHCDFICGKAEKLFEKIDFPKNKTGVILDPPRKGCDDVFLKQLSDFEPNRIVYVSCNVHSQARDVKYFLNETNNGNKYEIESIRGFDFFPQTHHVESVAVLVKKAN
ncbi:tRNA(m5U54)methyltransferase [Pichia californica]|uniref:tRNA(M5U54)methyltransferase n=1 Tax=Pichia californica TaxID=460514 RepID=A0A9P6WMP2_9ASCO|nr:tRNA(m5U54)methyltransferase [[Candida] californica]KAG0689815.1 tRNA(m5U54)methyltransferase [[Candida] californica]